MESKSGTIEELKVGPLTKKRSTRRASGGSGSNGGPGGSGGGDHSGNGPQDESKAFQPDKYRVGMGLLLLIVMMTFGALIGTYIVLATNRALEWKPFNLPFQVWVSTALIIVSSIDYELAKNSLFKDNQKKAQKWFLITAVVGMIFIASQFLVWLNLANQGYYASGNSYAGLFYILTAVHAVHVIGGIISLGWIVLKTQIATSDEVELVKRQWFARIVGWYWHFMGVLWLILLLLLGFYK